LESPLRSKLRGIDPDKNTAQNFDLNFLWQRPSDLSMSVLRFAIPDDGLRTIADLLKSSQS